MEAVGFGLAIVAEARTLATSIKNRISNYKKGPEKLLVLSSNTVTLAGHIAEVERLLSAFPRAVPPDVSVIFNETLTEVRDSLTSANCTMDDYFSKAFAASGVGAIIRLKSRIHRRLRATELSGQISAADENIKEASSRLLHLISILANAVEMEELVPRIDSLSIKAHNLTSAEGPKSEYRPGVTTPAVPNTVRLNFQAKDAYGEYVTPEGKLKYLVLSSTSSAAVTAAAGALYPAYGIVGMAGVGKTIALQGLAYDQDIQNRFPDGTQYMTLGQGATVQTVIREIVKILRLIGATDLLRAAENCSSLREAVDYAAMWFHGRVCLFLVDDIWPTDNCNTGFWTDLRQVLRGSSESRMAISTRSVAIAHCAGSVVDFGALDAVGSVSENIFMAHAAGHLALHSTHNSQKLRPSILKILSICGGLPIALEVTGCAAALLERTYGDFYNACDAYSKELEKKRTIIAHTHCPEGASLSAGISLSLNFLETEFLKWKSSAMHTVKHAIHDFYTSLSVLHNQAWIPVSVLSRMWDLDEQSALYIVSLFSGMSLATLQYRKLTSETSAEPGLVLHDMQLDFCQLRAIETNTRSLWQVELLNGYLKRTSDVFTCSLSMQSATSSAQNLLQFSPRSWWSREVPRDNYIDSNLASHLACGNLRVELASLLLDTRWTMVRHKIGGILALKSDFEWLDNLSVGYADSTDDMRDRDDVLRSFQLIFRVVRNSWGRLCQNLRAFQFEVCGRLFSLRKTNVIIDAYVTSLEAHTPRPLLLPLTPFFPEVSRAQIMEIPVEPLCLCVTCSPCGRYIAAGSGQGVVVAYSSSGEILQRIAGYPECMTCATFIEGSKTIACGSEDGTVVVWNWELNSSQILEGHSAKVTDVCSTGDGEQIFSCSADQTLRFWDANTGLQTGELLQGEKIHSMAICADHGKIALGLDSGTLKVVDIVSKQTIFEDSAAHEERVISLAFGLQGWMLATGSSDSTMQMWSAQTWTRIGNPLEGHQRDLLSVAFSPSGNQLASCSWDNTIRIWDVRSGKHTVIPPNMSGWVNTVTFTDDGKRIISAVEDGFVRIWDALADLDVRERGYSHTNAAAGVAISQDGLIVASASDDKTLRLWDSNTGTPIGVPLPRHAAGVRYVSFSPGGRKLVSSSRDKTLMLWDIETLTQIGDPLRGHSGEIECVSFSADGQRIVSGSCDRNVRLWHVRTGEQVGGPFRKQNFMATSAWESRDGSYVAAYNCFSETVII